MIKVCAEVLCRFEEVAALKVVSDNVHVGGPSRISVKKVHEGLVEKFHLPQGANSSALYVMVGTFTTLMRQGSHTWEGFRDGVT